MIRTKIGQAVDKRVAKILIVDDHPLIREGLANRLASEPDLEACGQAAGIAQAFDVYAATAPDLTLVDISRKNGDCIQFIKRLNAKCRTAKILVWSMFSDRVYAERVLRAGALGYINKEQSTDQIVFAIRRVLDGKLYLSDEMGDLLLRQSMGDSRLNRGRSSIDLLSDRELQVLRLIGEGRRTTAIALALHLSAKTVETYRDRIRTKLGLGDGVELCRYAFMWVLDID